MLIFCIALTGSVSVFGAVEKPDLPGSKAVASLKNDFPAATQVTWSEHHGQYIAGFTFQRTSVLATYDGEGTLLLTRIISDGADMPFDIKVKISKDYPGYSAEDMTECISGNTVCYYLLLKRQRGTMVTWLRVKAARGGYPTVVQKLFQKVPHAQG